MLTDAVEFSNATRSRARSRQSSAAQSLPPSAENAGVLVTDREPLAELSVPIPPGTAEPAPTRFSVPAAAPLHNHTNCASLKSRYAISSLAPGACRIAPRRYLPVRRLLQASAAVNLIPLSSRARISFCAAKTASRVSHSVRSWALPKRERRMEAGLQDGRMASKTPGVYRCLSAMRCDVTFVSQKFWCLVSVRAPDVLRSAPTGHPSSEQSQRRIQATFESMVHLNGDAAGEPLSASLVKYS